MSIDSVSSNIDYSRRAGSPRPPGAFPESPKNPESSADVLAKTPPSFDDSEAKSRYSFYQDRFDDLLLEKVKNTKFKDSQFWLNLSKASVPSLLKIGLNVTADVIYQSLVGASSFQNSEIVRGLEQQSRASFKREAIKSVVSTLVDSGTSFAGADEAIKIRDSYTDLASEIVPYTSQHKPDVAKALKKWQRKISRIDEMTSPDEALQIIDEALWLSGLPQQPKDLNYWDDPKKRETQLKQLHTLLDAAPNQTKKDERAIGYQKIRNNSCADRGEPVTFQTYKQGHGGTGKSNDSRAVAKAFEQELIEHELGNHDDILENLVVRAMDLDAKRSTPLRAKVGGVNFNLGTAKTTNPFFYFDETAEGLQNFQHRARITKFLDPERKTSYVEYFDIDLDTSRVTRFFTGNPNLRDIVPNHILQRLPTEDYSTTPQENRRHVLMDRSKQIKDAAPPDARDAVIHALVEMEPIIFAVNEACKEQSYRLLQRCAENIGALAVSDHLYGIAYEKNRYISQVIHYYEALHPQVRAVYQAVRPEKIRGRGTKKLLSLFEIQQAATLSVQSPTRAKQWANFCKLTESDQKEALSFDISKDKEAHPLLKDIPSDLLGLRRRALDLESSRESSPEPEEEMIHVAR